MSKDSNDEYDVVIVGGGISGMYAAHELLKRRPTQTVALAEKYNTLGGRISTFHKASYQWEEGAGRIPLTHKLVMNLIKEYKCTWIPIESKQTFKPSNTEQGYPDPFNSIYVPLFLAPLKTLDRTILGTNTLETILEKLYGKDKTKSILDAFPYFSESKILRADLALDIFLEGEMKSFKGFGFIKEGLSELVNRLEKDLVQRGCTILLNHELQTIQKVPDEPKSTDCIFTKKTIRAKNVCIITMCRCHVANLPFLKNVPVLKHVIGKPLFRIYMVFPTKNGRSWFSDLDSTITPERIRYFIPINSEKGICMASYTDGADTEYYHKIIKAKGEKGLEKVVLKDLRALFQDKMIEDPLLTKGHYWGTGASYWLPGNYDPERMSNEALQPREDFPGLYMCGESWSMRQAWIEGSLEHTTKCLNLLG